MRVLIINTSLTASTCWGKNERREQADESQKDGVRGAGGRGKRRD